MTIQHISRTNKTYYLHVGTRKTGKPNYYFSTDAGGPLASSIPEGYEVYENVGGQVFLRKKTKSAILPEELALVEKALRKHGPAWQFRVEAKKNAIIIYDADDMEGLDEMWRECRGRPLSDSEMCRHASYTAVMRFALADKDARLFEAERFCFRGSVDDWIPIGSAGPLASHVRRFVKHLGRESFFELY